MGNEVIEIPVARLQQIRNLLTFVDAKNKPSRAYLEASIAELDTILKPYETKEEPKNG